MNPITVNVRVHADIDTVWEYWNNPTHIQNWAFASDDWECPYAENSLIVGGTFVSTMSAKDKSASFNFSGIYTTVIPKSLIEYTMEDGRKVSVSFEQVEDTVQITETFDPESENTLELQKAGWQAIVGNFKSYVEKQTA